MSVYKPGSFRYAKYDEQGFGIDDPNGVAASPSSVPGGGESSPTLTGLDTTGATDHTGEIAAALLVALEVRLPEGVIRANVHVPTGRVLRGCGRPKFDTATSAWEAIGTLLIGRVDFDGTKSAGVSDLSIDNYASGQNAIQGLGVTTRDIAVQRVNTRANNHNQLWEQNTTAALVDTRNNILVEDSTAYQGPNGFAVKMRGVTLRRCHSEAVTTQHFAIVSDNINGAAILSRAQDVELDGCTASGGNEGLRIYSRDYGNTGTVQPVRNVRWDGTVSGGSGRMVRTGDFSSTATAGGFARVSNDYVTIDGGYYTGAPGGSSAMLLDNVRRPIVTGRCRFGANGGGGDHIWFGGTVTQPQVAREIIYETAATSPTFTQIVTANTMSVAVTLLTDTLIFRNTSTVGVNALTGAAEGQRIDVLIDDDFTTFAIGAVTRRGKGVGCSVRFISGAWVEVSDEVQLNQSSEVVAGFAASFAADYSGPKATRLVVGMSSHITSMTLTLPSAPDGTPFSLRLYPTNGGAKGLAWPAAIKWPDDITAPTAVPDGKHMLVSMYKSGATLVVTRMQTYTP